MTDKTRPKAEEGGNCGRCLHRSEKMTGPHCKPCLDAEQPYKVETKFTGFKPMPKEK